MASKEHNATMTELANNPGFPLNKCIDLESFEWLFSYQPQFMWVIFIMSFIENLFVISVFVLHKSRCTVTEIYLGNMAAADLIFVIGHPFRALYVSHNYYWPFGGFMCVAVFSLFLLNLYSSIYFLMMVSIERYLTLVKATSIGHLRRSWWARVRCGIIWMLAAVLCMPNAMLRQVLIDERSNTTTCVSVRSSPNWYIAINVIINVLGFLVPMVVTTACTSQMILVLRNNPMRRWKKEKKERRATWLVLSVFLVFIVCWFPFNISTFINILNEFNVLRSCRLTSDNYIVYNISIYLVNCNSCINPVLYCMLGNRFRQKAREVYSRLLCKGPDRWRPSTQLRFLSP
ncbi:B2 bradykinin receptor-like [Dendropsophus ebraccatus]|uniref:B2 bradykinin receptor-like n=1 Tax=Dendropsophus ebraccatus TaxID=150705 RepID=UPI003831CC30